MWIFVVAAFVAALVGGGVNGQTCRSAAAQQCKDRIFQVIQQHSQDFTGSDVSSICPNLRDNMACLLWQAANCQTREQQQRSGEHILAAKNYLDRFCDLDGGWKNSRCYQYDEISRCENTFTQRRTGSESCDAYNRFKDCVKEVLSRRCSRSDEQSFPSYLVDRARELAWTCGSVSSSSSSTYDRSYDRNNPYDNSRTDRYDSNNRYDSRYDQNRYDPNNPNTRYNNDRSNYNDRNNDRYNDRYNDRNDRYRPGYLPSQNTDDSYCLYKAQDSIRECDSNHQRRQYSARRYHADERIKESCCATIEYKNCLRQSLNNHCREYGYNTIDSIVQQKVRDADNDCRQFDSYRCASGASALMVSMVAVAASVILAATRLF